MQSIIKTAIPALALTGVTAEDQAGLPSGLGRNIKTTKDMLEHALTGLTGADDPADVAKSLIKDYGCYCYPVGSKVVTSRFNYHGAALDPLDDLCRKMYFKQKCFDIDADEGLYNGQLCEADNKFEWYVDSNNEIQCGDENDVSYSWRRPCKMNNCAVEREFVEGVVAWYTDPSFSRNFDYKGMDDATYQATCVNTPSGSGTGHDLKCCGTTTQTYETGTGVQATSYNRRTYNSLIKDCCDDGTVAFTGACP